MKLQLDKSLLLFLVITLLAIPACTRNTESQKPGSNLWYAQNRQLYYGIPVHLSFYPKNQALADEVWRYLEGIDDTFNDYNEASEISSLNRNREKRVLDISPQLANAFSLAHEVYQMTNGAFDITIGPIRDQWKTAAEANRRPTMKEISAALEFCGLNKTSIKERSLTLSSPGLRFDFGGIIKGIAVDQAIAILKKNGVRSAMVQIGGETAVFGNSPRGKPYVIGIQNPVDLSQIWATVYDLGHGLSISTSGNYRNPIEIGGKEFYHIIDPRTGMPVDIHLLSVSVVFPTTGKNWLADGLATACAVIGTKKSIKMFDNHGAEALLLVKEDGIIREIKTTGWNTLTQKGQ